MTNTWTHRDALRLSHPVGLDQRVGNFILGKQSDVQTLELRPDDLIAGFVRMQEAGSVDDVLSVLDDYSDLPWETIPTEFLKSPDVWKVLFYNGQLKGQALLRNVVRLSRIGAFNDMAFAKDYANRLVDVDMMRRSRLHPINYLNTMVVYNEGQMDRSTGWTWSAYRKPKDWVVSSQIAGALEDGFTKSFKVVEPAGKRTLVAVDVSGSMSQAASGLDLSCYEAAAAIAMTIVRTEPMHMIKAFSSDLRDIDVHAGSSMQAVMDKFRQISMGGTDCAQPMIWAQNNDVEVDTFVVLTDNETWAGRVQPFQALKNYRKATGIPARLAVFGMTATPFTIADPSDSGMMDFVGLDANAVKVLADFSAGRL